MNETEREKKDKVHSRKGRLLYSLGAVPSALPYNMISASFVFFMLQLNLDRILVWLFQVGCGQYMEFGMQ